MSIILVLTCLAHINTDEELDFTPEETLKGQTDLLEARAKYVLRNDVVDAVMMANPILKAVHSDPNSSPVER